MSKTSSVYRNLKRVKMVAKYANVRAKLKAIADDKSASEEDRFQATLKLAALPRNSSKVRIETVVRLQDVHVVTIENSVLAVLN